MKMAAPTDRPWETPNRGKFIQTSALVAISLYVTAI